MPSECHKMPLWHFYSVRTAAHVFLTAANFKQKETNYGEMGVLI